MKFVLQLDAVGWSEKYIKKTCSKCREENSIQYVQTQKRYKISKLKMINSGPRGFSKECTNCLDMTPLTKSERKVVSKLEYYFKRPTEDNMIKKPSTSLNAKYRVLDKKKRAEIRSENIKEGVYSSGIGILLGLILSIYFSIAIWIIPITIIFGIYASLEDPEIKFKATIEKSRRTKEKSKGLNQKKKDNKRLLQ